jgi:acyl-coenzyme A synthetase/AMP-(fatty) acid ligase
VPVENVFNRHPAVGRSALVAVNGKPALVVEPKREHWPHSVAARRRLAEELGALAAADPVTVLIRRFYFHPSFPVDARHNAKIFRDKLGVWATAQSAIEVGPADAGNA